MTLPWQFFSSLLYLTDRFHVAVGVVSNSAQKKPKCGENIGNTLCCTLLDIFFCSEHILESSVILSRQMYSNMESIC